MRRWVRTLLAFTVALAAWIVATPARAALLSDASGDGAASPPSTRAPLCDDRAATMFAPAPQLQAPQTSIDMGDAKDECLSSFLDDGVAHQGGEAPRGAPSAPDAAMTVVTPAVMPATHVTIHFPRAAFVALPCGVCSRLDRPPRF